MPVIPDQVPAEPIYTITLTATGAYIDGQPVPGSSTDAEESRRAALREIYVKAALHGRAVRLVAKEADGTTWPMIMDTGGNVITLHAPHPVPPSPAATTSAAPPLLAPAASPQPAHDWAAPLPPAYQALYDDLRTAESAGDLPNAVALAARLEEELTATYGPLHPHAVNVATLRASLTLRLGGDWYETVELLVHTALRRREAGAQPVQDTVGTARNAHAAWRSLARGDAEGAAELAERVAGMLEQFGEDRRTRDVLDWVEGATMISQGELNQHLDR
ncbi:hypothetical protein ACFY8C_38500 [Streptomyces flavochromogenes]|uniref:Tetratricopeptide repeat protein n=1 Tax=Streptomyces flavochromogenes TaxID=68199 RepID=A0ABW6Y349_9ACTN